MGWTRDHVHAHTFESITPSVSKQMKQQDEVAPLWTESSLVVALGSELISCGVDESRASARCLKLHAPWTVFACAFSFWPSEGDAPRKGKCIIGVTQLG